jgi:hypothetical protein
MLAKFQVFTEVHNRWPAKADRPAGESFNLLLLDMSKPSKHALRDMYHYRLTDEERAQYWGTLDGKLIEVGVNDISNGDKGPVLRGSIVSVSEK